MKVYNNACDCRYCRGTVPDFIKENKPRKLVSGTSAYCLWDNGDLKANLQGENPVYYAYSGGRNPVCVVLDEGEKVQFTKYLNPLPGEIARFDASVHGCFKVRKRMYMVGVKS